MCDDDELKISPIQIFLLYVDDFQRHIEKLPMSVRVLNERKSFVTWHPKSEFKMTSNNVNKFKYLIKYQISSIHSGLWSLLSQYLN